MKGFKHTGNGPRAGHSFPASHGFHGSTSPLRKAIGGMVDEHKPVREGAISRGKPPMTEQLAEHGGKTPLLDGYKKGGRIVEFKSGGRVVRFATGGKVRKPKFAKGGHVKDFENPGKESEGGGDYARGGRPTGFKRGGCR